MLLVSETLYGDETVPTAKRELPPAANVDVDFARDIEPILKRRCIRCHGAKKAEAGLRLDHRSLALDGGDRGPAIVPGKSADSLLVLAAVGLAVEDLIMPPTGRQLTKDQIGLLRAWIDRGAQWPGSDVTAVERLESDHWAFRAPVRPAVPIVERPAWVRNPVDAFVLAQLESEDWQPSADADRTTLIRRLSLDLLGLPPSPEEIDAFVADPHPEAYEKLVDRLLSSPHFGERWGRHWLDLARYADSNGYEDDRFRPDAWRYRDWVVDAFNNDRPYDDFTVEQVGGDLLPGAAYAQRVATGFHRMVPTNEAGNTSNVEEYRIKTAKDRTNTTATVWLGLTAGCAECHSHKYDPLSQREYYQLFAFFNTAVDASVKAPRLAKKYWLAYERAKRNFKGHVNNTPEPPSTKALTITNNPEPPESFVHVRGDFLQKGRRVEPKAPKFLPELKPRRADAPDRLDLGLWIASPKSPLTARVAVNRFWQHLFGRALVRTPEDFGTKGKPPTHPKLIDWLAVEFMESGWQRKSILRTIVLSATYRQSSRLTDETFERDPENLKLSRQNRLRVEAEIIRDVALAASGRFHPGLGGPSVQPPLPAGLAERKELKDERFREEDSGVDRYRRGLYTNVQRTFPYPAMMAFDTADANVSCTRRDRSTTPLQALTLLNERAFFECAQELGRRVAAHPGTRDERLVRAWRWCLGRVPNDEEIDVLSVLLEKHRALYRDRPEEASRMAGTAPLLGGLTAMKTAPWVGVARTLLNLEEFITRE